METPQANPSTATSDRRGSDRVPAKGRALIELPEDRLDVRINNTSETGFLFTLDQPLELEMQLPGEAESIRVRLMRCHTLPGGGSGWGVERVNAED